MKKIPRTGEVDPYLPENQNKALWIISGYTCFPDMLCAKVSTSTGEPVIWGYSVYKNSPGFRTLGIDLPTWIAKNHAASGGKHPPAFFDDQALALEYIGKLTFPRCSIK